MAKSISRVAAARITKIRPIPRAMLPKSEAEIQFILGKLGIREPKPCRKKNETRIVRDKIVVEALRRGFKKYWRALEILKDK